MKILCLYNNEQALELFDWIREQGHDTVLCNNKIEADWCLKQKFDLTVSYTYRFILSEETLYALKKNAVNIHISYLPWNRGADPNMWSIVDETPKGVTLHFMDRGLDSGNIIAQELVELETNDTLKSSYEKLNIAAKRMFKAAFLYYPFWNEMCKKSIGKGTYHASKDGRILREQIKTYDIKVCEFKELARNICKKY